MGQRRSWIFVSDSCTSATIEEISKDFLPPDYSQDWTDPFSDAPLCYTADETGFVVYSVGEDGVDDGGNITAPEGSNASDVGFQFQISEPSTD